MPVVAMFAKSLALRCLLTVSVLGGCLSCLRAADHVLVIYEGVEPGQPTEPLEQMRREMQNLMHSAGVRVEWRDLRYREAVEGAEVVVVAELQGVCGLDPENTLAIEGPMHPRRLASSSVSDGSVLPFNSIDCRSLSRFLAHALANESQARQNYLFGRAMARLLAHELYHYLAQTRCHAHAGLAKPCFTVRDLLAAGFEFEGSTLAKLRQHPGYTPTGGPAGIKRPPAVNIPDPPGSPLEAFH
jgi:hypothetical protein